MNVGHDGLSEEEWSEVFIFFRMTFDTGQTEMKNAEKFFWVKYIYLGILSTTVTMSQTPLDQLSGVNLHLILDVYHHRLLLQQQGSVLLLGLIEEEEAAPFNPSPVQKLRRILSLPQHGETNPLEKGKSSLLFYSSGSLLGAFRV